MLDQGQLADAEPLRAAPRHLEIANAFIEHGADMRQERQERAIASCGSFNKPNPVLYAKDTAKIHADTSQQVTARIRGRPLLMCSLHDVAGIQAAEFTLHDVAGF